MHYKNKEYFPECKCKTSCLRKKKLPRKTKLFLFPTNAVLDKIS